MLKLTVRAGDYINIGEDIRIVFTGGATQKINVLLDAPKKYNIVRSTAIKDGIKGADKKSYYKDRDLSEEARARIKNIIVKDLREQK